MFRYSVFAAGLVGLLAVSAAVARDQTVVTFDDLPLGTTDLTADMELFKVNISGGTVVTLDPSARRSGTQGYSGSFIHIATEDAYDFSLPGVGAWISSASAVTLQAYEYDLVTASELPLPPITLSPPVTNDYLWIGSIYLPPRYITSADFFVTDGGSFVMDDLTLGLEGVGVGFPEPASWATMLAGLGLVGGMMRRSRKVIVSFAG